MKLLILGDMAATGFGTVTQDLGRAMLDNGIDVRFLSWNETRNLPEPFASRTALLGVPEGWLAAQATRSKLEHITEGSLFEDSWTPEVALVLGDVGSLLESKIAAWFPADLPVFHYAPVEGIGLPPSWAAFWKRFPPIAMSEFGANEIEPLIGYRPSVIYHGIDPAFHPVTPAQPILWKGNDGVGVTLRSKTDCKRALGFTPDQVVILRTDANVVRKAYFELMWAVAPVLNRHSEAVFAIHARVRDYGGDLDDMRSHFPERIRSRMGPLGMHERFGSMPREVMAALYNAADIYVSNSCEGFGLTIAEAMACGVPVVALDWSAVPEVVGGAGVLVPLGHTFVNIYAHLWGVADQDGMTTAIESLVTSKGKRRSLGAIGPLRVQSYFQWPAIARQFVDVMSLRLAEKVAA